MLGKLGGNWKFSLELRIWRYFLCGVMSLKIFGLVLAPKSGRVSAIVMAFAFVLNLRNIWPFSVLKSDDLTISNELVRKLRIPERTKQFVYAVREPETQSVIYILSAQSLSEWSASDADCLIRDIRPDAVVAQVGHSTLTEIQSEESVLSDGFDYSFPTSSLGVVKRRFFQKVYKERYEDIAGNLVLQKIFGVGFHGHFLAAKRVAHDVNGGEAVDTNVISEAYAFRIAVEGLRISQNNAGRLPFNKIRDSNLHKVEFSDLPVEDKSHALLVEALRGQTKKFKTIVAVVDASGLAGLRKHWNTPVPLEVKDMVGELVTNCEGEGEMSNDTDRKRLLTDKTLVAVGAMATAVLGTSSLSNGGATESVCLASRCLQSEPQERQIQRISAIKMME